MCFNRVSAALSLIGKLRLASCWFERTPRGHKSTPEAKRLFEAVEQSYLGIRQIKAVADAIRNLGAGKISFGMIPSYSGEMTCISQLT